MATYEDDIEYEEQAHWDLDLFKDIEQSQVNRDNNFCRHAYAM